MNVKKYHFGNDGGDSGGDASVHPSSSSSSSCPTSLTVVLHEDLDHAAGDNFGCYTWISAPVLAHFVWRHRKLLRRRHVIEIGAGPALPGIVAGLSGAVGSLTLADSRVFHPAATRLARRNADANGLPEARVIDVTWGLLSPEMLGMTLSTATPSTTASTGPSLAYDVILASDCFYDTHNFEDVVVTIATLLQMHLNATQSQTPSNLTSDSSFNDNDDGHENDGDDASRSFRPPELWMTYQERSSGRSIRHLLAKYGLCCVTEMSWRQFVESASSEEERRQLEELDDLRQIDSVWILVIRNKEGQ